MSAAADAARCSVCLDEYSDESRIDGCVHHFCFQCIHRWSLTTNLCPQCKAEFTQIRKLQAGVGTKRRNGRDASVIDVRPKKQRAEYDDEELVRLGLNDGSDNDEDDDDDDDDDEESESGSSVRRRTRGYSTRDGFVVGDDEPIEYSSDSELFDDDDNDSVSVDESVSVSISVSSSSCSSSNDSDIVVVRQTRNGVEIPLRGELRNVRIH